MEPRAPGSVAATVLRATKLSVLSQDAAPSQHHQMSRRIQKSSTAESIRILMGLSCTAVVAVGSQALTVGFGVAEPWLHALEISEAIVAAALLIFASVRALQSLGPSAITFLCEHSD